MQSCCYLIRRLRRFLRKEFYRHTLAFLSVVFGLLLFLVCLCSGGCSPSSFDEFLNNFFVTEVDDNTLNLRYTLTDPSAYGIPYGPSDTVTLGDCSSSARRNCVKSCHSALEELEKFHTGTFSVPQHVSYDVLTSYLKNSIALSDYDLYQEAFTPYNGVQSQLPILLAEYPLSNETDVQVYLQLLQDLPRYYDSLISYEKEKAAAGLFMSDEACCMVIDSCEEMVSEGLNPLLCDSFLKRLNKISTLTDSDRSIYIEENQSIYKNDIVPAYEKLIAEMTGLLGSGRNCWGLCNYPSGADYYSCLVQGEVGCDESMEQLFADIENWRSCDMGVCDALIQENPSLSESLDCVSLEFQDAPAMLTHLQQAMLVDFPACESSCYTLSSVDEALSDFLAPAFYITAPYDAANQNVIYLNSACDYETLDLFTTLAHEGYPGHLYQTVMSYRLGLLPFRCLLDYPGYTEGWATYVEMNSYNYAGLDPAVASFLSHNDAVMLSLYATSDIGVHYYGWKTEELTKLWSDYGISNPATIDSIRKLIVHEPGNYLRYYVGCKKIQTLRHSCEEKYQEEFDCKTFHSALLAIGPAPFPVIEKYLPYYYKSALDD